MRILLSDETPSGHFGPDFLREFEGRGLVWHNPRKDDASPEGFDAVLLHASDEKFGRGVADAAAAADIPLVLFSGGVSSANDLEVRLRAKYSPSFLTTAPLLDDIPKSLTLALDNDDVSFLKWDRLSDALELLTILWAVGLVWETEGAPYVFAAGDRTYTLALGEGEPARVSLLGPDGRIQRFELNRLLTTDGRKVIDLTNRINLASDAPGLDMSSLSVGSLDDYNEALAGLRDSLLGWARGRGDP